MYDKLIKNLRHDSASALQNCEFDFVHGWMLKAADAIEELEKQLDEETEYATALACNVPRWIPVTERLPDENGKYLTVFTVNTIPPRPVIEVSCYAKDLYKIDKYDFQDKKKKSGFYQYDSEWGYFEMTDISHWMPMPIPPLPEDGET